MFIWTLFLATTDTVPTQNIDISPRITLYLHVERLPTVDTIKYPVSTLEFVCGDIAEGQLRDGRGFVYYKREYHEVLQRWGFVQCTFQGHLNYMTFICSCDFLRHCVAIQMF